MKDSLYKFFNQIFGEPPPANVYWMPYIHNHKEWHDWQVRKVIKSLKMMPMGELNYKFKTI